MFLEYPKIKDDVEKETIKLYDLKFERNSFGRNEQKSKDKKKYINKIKYYKIEDKKQQELENVFKQLKTKIKLNFKLNIKSSHKEIKFCQKFYLI